MPETRSYPPFSVLMSVYDRESTRNLDESLNSLTRSSVPVTELVLVEDGPLRDELHAVIARYRTQLQIVSVRLPENLGLAAALNAGLRHCSHEHVARFDTDDLNVEHRFQVQLSYFEQHPRACVVGSAIEEFDSVSGAALGCRTLPTTAEELYGFAKLRCPINHPSVMFRKSTIIAAGGYRKFVMEDYVLWVHCLVNGVELVNVPDVLVRMRSGAGQLQRRRGWHYFRCELQIAREFRRVGFLSWLEWARFIAYRIPARLLPAPLLLDLYGRYLRGPVVPK